MTPERAPVGRVLSFRQILDEAMRVTRARFLTIYPSVAIPVALASVLMLAPQRLLLGAFQSRVGAGSPGGVGSLVPGLAVWLACLALLMAVSGVAMAAMYSAASAAVEGRPFTMAGRWGWAIRPAVLGTMFLVGVMVLFGSLFCLVPGLIVGILAAFTLPVMTIEGRFGMAAIERSQELVKYNPEGRFSAHPGWRLLAISVVGGVLSYAVTLLVQVPFAVAQQVLVLRSVTDPERGPQAVFSGPWLWLQVPQTLLGSLASHAVMLYMLMASALLYREMRRKKEGEDLEAAMDDLGVPTVPGVAEPR